MLLILFLTVLRGVLFCYYFNLCYFHYVCYFAINAIFTLRCAILLFVKMCYFAVYAISTLSWEVFYFAYHFLGRYAINAIFIFLGSVLFWFYGINGRWAILLFKLFSLFLERCSSLLLMLFMLLMLSREVWYNANYAISAIFTLRGVLFCRLF